MLPCKKNDNSRVWGWFHPLTQLKLVKPINYGKSWSWLLLGLLLSSLAGCQPALIKIETIKPKKNGKVVYLSGKVTQKAPFINTAAYQIQDDTGSVWVVTQQTPPSIEQQIAIKGKIQYQSLPFADQELGDFYVQELEQLENLKNIK